MYNSVYFQAERRAFEFYFRFVYKDCGMGDQGAIILKTTNRAESHAKPHRKDRKPPLPVVFLFILIIYVSFPNYALAT